MKLVLLKFLSGSKKCQIFSFEFKEFFTSDHPPLGAHSGGGKKVRTVNVKPSIKLVVQTCRNANFSVSFVHQCTWTAGAGKFASVGGRKFHSMTWLAFDATADAVGSSFAGNIFPM